MALLKQQKREQLRLQIANGERWIHNCYVFTRTTTSLSVTAFPISIPTPAQAPRKHLCHIIEESKVKTTECIADVLPRKMA